MFRSVMRSPEGQEYPNVGCYLEVVPNERLIWTDALLPGYRPAENPFFTAVLTFEPSGKGTRYVATAIHRDEAGRKKHEEMGFHGGLGHSGRSARRIHQEGDVTDCRQWPDCP